MIKRINKTKLLRTLKQLAENYQLSPTELLISYISKYLTRSLDPELVSIEDQQYDLNLTPYIKDITTKISDTKDFLTKLPNCNNLEDFLLTNDLILQNLVRGDEGRTKGGIFYTPIDVAEALIDHCQLERQINLPNFRLIDLAMGSGIFLRLIIERFAPPETEARIKFIQEKVFGIDADPLAVMLAKLAVGLTVKKKINLNQNLHWDNTLIPNNIATKNLLNQKNFNLVIGNPPFGLARGERISDSDNQILKKIFAEELPGKLNKYLMFLSLGYQITTPGGQVAMITPNAWLAIPAAQTLRKKFIKEKSLEQIVSFKKSLFPKLGVETIFVLIKKYKCKSTAILRYRAAQSNLIYSDEVTLEENHTIPLFYNSKVSLVLNKIKNHSQSLKESGFKPLIAPQYYTTGKGQPPQLSSAAKDKIFHARTKIDENHFPYLEGRDLTPLRINWSGEYLNFGPWVAEFQPIERFQAARVLVREITAKPPYLITACATDKTFFYNRSILHILPTAPTTESLIKPLANFLSSKLASFYLLNCGQKTQRKLFPKILNSDLEAFPIPKELFRINEEFTGQERSILDQKVYSMFGLSPDEIQVIEEFLSNPPF